MSIPPMASAAGSAAPRILIVSASRQVQHPLLRDLTAAPSVLGSHYIVVTMTANEAAVEADQPFTLIIVDDDQAVGAHIVDALRAAAPQTPLLVVARPHQPTTAAQLRAAVAQILHSGQAERAPTEAG